MDPGIPIPPPLYGGHERLVDMFVKEYINKGHDVSLLAGPDSKSPGKTFHFGINDLKRSKWQKIKEVMYAWRFLIRRRNDFDLIHNFGRLAYLLPIINTKQTKLMTYGREVSQRGIRLTNLLPNNKLTFTGCSDYCVSTGNIAGSWKTVYNAIDFSKYEFQDQVEENAPLMFLGRMDKIKGLHHAIDVALATHNKLWIGGNIPNTPDNLRYYEQVIKPRIDGQQIIYLGALDDCAKNTYLGKSKGLLFPIEWDEPFGMVMVEAMACGTPVIAFKKGAVPEVIKESINGLVVNNIVEMIYAIKKLPSLSRRTCRDDAFKRFDTKVIAEAYLKLHS
jgi:glycosyltransferase involved in cell wall biosynthesis